MTRLDTAGHGLGVISEVLPAKLVGFFGGSARDYKVASFLANPLAVIFLSWVARESAIGRSPLCLDGTTYSFSNWMVAGEEKCGHLRHKAWIRLRNWPLLCWSELEVKAAVSGFGELWEVDEHSSGADNVAYYRARVRCQDARLIP